MNNNTISNKTIDFRTLFLANIRSTWIADMCVLYIIVPLGIFGTILNSISLKIFFKNSNKNLSLFKFLQVNSASCLMLGLIHILYFYFSAYNLFDLAISYFGRIFKCYIASSFMTVFFFFYTNSLDVVINLERALNFSNKYQRIKQISPYKICFVVLIICLIINIPNNMAQDMVKTEDLHVKLRYCLPSSFVLKSYGRILLLVSYFIQGPVLLLLNLVTNIISVLSFRNFIKKKSEAINVNNNQMTPTQLKKIKKFEKLHKSLLKMTVGSSVFSFVILLIQFVAQFFLFVFPSLLDNYTTGSILFVYMFVIAFKQFVNFFIHLQFNRIFRRDFFEFCPCVSSLSNATNSVVNFE